VGFNRKDILSYPKHNRESIVTSVALNQLQAEYM